MSARDLPPLAPFSARLTASISQLLLILIAVLVSSSCRHSIEAPTFDEVESEVTRLLDAGDRAEAEALLDAAIDLHRRASPHDSPDSKKLKERLQGLRTPPKEKTPPKGAGDSGKASGTAKPDSPAPPPSQPRAPFNPDRYPFLNRPTSGSFGTNIDPVQFGIIAASGVAVVCLVGLIVLLAQPSSPRPPAPGLISVERSSTVPRQESFLRQRPRHPSQFEVDNPDRYEALLDRPTVPPVADLPTAIPSDHPTVAAGSHQNAPAPLTNPVWMLRWTDEAGEPHAATFDPIDLARSGNRLVIGRSPAMAQLIVGLSNVSRRHAELYLEGDQLFIRDLESGNGTFVNGQPLGGARRSVLLRPGDRISLGKHVDLHLTMR